MNTNVKIRGVAAGCLLAMLAGCSTMKEIRSDSADRYNQHTEAQRAVWEGRTQAYATPVAGPIISDLPYVDARSVRRPARYPATFTQNVTFNSPAGVSMQTLAHRIEELTGVRVVYESEVHVGEPIGALALPSSTASLGAPSLQGGLDSVLSGLPVASAAPAAASGSQAEMPRVRMPISYTGNVTGLLNAVGEATEAHWDYQDGRNVVQFYRFKTETFRLPAVQGESERQSNMGGQNQSAGESTPITMASASGTHSTSGSVWTEVEATIQGLLSPEGTFALSPVGGLVTVRDRPARLESIRTYMDRLAEGLQRQVHVDIEIFRVVLNESDSRALNWKLSFRDMLGNFVVGGDTFAGRPDVVEGGLTSTVISVPDTDASGRTLRWGGSSVVLDALSQLGRTSVVRTASIVASNNQPAPLKTVRRTSYLAKVAQNIASSNNELNSTGPTLTPGMVETGLNVYVLPHVMDDGKRMLLKMMGSFSTLISMDQFGNDQAMIQLPQVESHEFDHQAWLNSGETLLLAGFENSTSGTDTASPIGRNAWFLGGRSRAQHSRELVVIAIRPAVTAARSGI